MLVQLNNIFKMAKHHCIKLNFHIRKHVICQARHTRTKQQMSDVNLAYQGFKSKCHESTVTDEGLSSISTELFVL